MLTVATAFCAALSSSCQSFLGTGPTGHGIPERFGIQGVNGFPEINLTAIAASLRLVFGFEQLPESANVCKTSSYIGCKLSCDFVHQWANKPCDKPKKLGM
jgi:hypothetical protein